MHYCWEKAETARLDVQERVPDFSKIIVNILTFWDGH